MDYKHYTTEDFIQDESFQQWVYEPDAALDAYWIDLLNRYPHLNKHADEARQFLLIFDASEQPVPDVRINNLKNRIDKIIDGNDYPVRKPTVIVPLKKNIPKKRKPFGLYLAAASVTILLGVLYLSFHPHALDPIIALAEQNFENKEVTPRGERTLVTLEDSTRVWLNADSKLIYPKSFAGSKTREVLLDGEAFFDVTEDRNKPFVVVTSSIRIRVLGTAFNIRSYSNDAQVRTTLVRGKVVIESEDNTAEPVTLLPSQQAVFEKQSGKIMLESQIDTEKFTSWREGKLSFDEQPLYVIIGELERWYNVTITVEDKASLGCPFSAKIDNVTLEEVMELFRASEGIDYSSKEKGVIIIKGKLCDQ